MVSHGVDAAWLWRSIERGSEVRPMFYVVRHRHRHAGKQKIATDVAVGEIELMMKKGFRPVMYLYEKGLPRHNLSLVKYFELDAFGEWRVGCMCMVLQYQIEPGGDTVRHMPFFIFHSSLLIAHSSFLISYYSLLISFAAL